MTRVLYVEDESLLAIAMEGAMQSSGFNVQLAYDGEQGIAQARSFRPQIIVTDYMMPRVDGLTMLRIMRDEGINAPVIVTTAVPERDFAPEVRQQFDLYLGKPFTEEELLDALRGLSSDGWS
jgi:DNA-binding response OmpR family regulator